MTSNNRPSKSSLFSYLLLLTFFFILIEISLLIQASEFYFGDYKTIADHLGVPLKVIPGILYFVGIQLSVHLVFAMAVWFLARFMCLALGYDSKTEEKAGVIIWFISILTVLLSNQLMFPNSKFAILTGTLLPDIAARLILNFLLGALTIVAILALRGLYRVLSVKLRLICVVMLMLFATFAVGHRLLKNSALDAATPVQPNIILIGIDALRPDFLGFFGDKKVTPHLDDFLNQSTVFADALTPLARTFPAWVSILTGQYPKRNGVRFNLPLLQHFDWKNTLPSMLRSAGYQTLFATDEVRFSNIDQRFGFDTVVAPPIGFNDFLLGNLNDFPISNLLVNTWAGQFLFPHSYANRPVYMTYQPDRFLDALKPHLRQSRTKPLFLAIHFCLPHFPYYWGEEKAHDDSLQNYRAAISRVDQQFQDFLNLLNDNKLLDHSIVVLLSDHGEAFELPGDRVTEAALFVPSSDESKSAAPNFYPPGKDKEEINQSAGHGTDVLGLTQQHVLLAFRLYNTEKNNVIVVPGKVSLLDIKPTILDLLNKNVPSSLDGRSLKEVIIGQEKSVSNDRHFFMESDFSPQAVRSVHPETRDVVFQGINFFQIDESNARLTVKKEMVDRILSSKQYANVYQEWILALYPQTPTIMMPVLVNLQNGLWTNDLNTSFALKSPAKEMLRSLRHFYGSDIHQVLTEKR